MKSKVYVETTIPSFYHEDRTEPEIVARREWTREWWDNHRDRYVVVTSPAVLDELSANDYPKDKREQTLVTPIELLGE